MFQCTLIRVSITTGYNVPCHINSNMTYGDLARIVCDTAHIPSKGSLVLHEGKSQCPEEFLDVRDIQSGIFSQGYSVRDIQS